MGVIKEIFKLGVFSFFVIIILLFLVVAILGYIMGGAIIILVKFWYIWITIIIGISIFYYKDRKKIYTWFKKDKTKKKILSGIRKHPIITTMIISIIIITFIVLILQLYFLIRGLFI